MLAKFNSTQHTNRKRMLEFKVVITYLNSREVRYSLILTATSFPRTSFVWWLSLQLPSRVCCKINYSMAPYSYILNISIAKYNNLAKLNTFLATVSLSTLTTLGYLVKWKMEIFQAKRMFKQSGKNNYCQ